MKAIEYQATAAKVSAVQRRVRAASRDVDDYLQGDVSLPRQFRDFVIQLLAAEP